MVLRFWAAGLSGKGFKPGPTPMNLSKVGTKSNVCGTIEYAWLNCQHWNSHQCNATWAGPTSESSLPEPLTIHSRKLTARIAPKLAVGILIQTLAFPFGFSSHLSDVNNFTCCSLCGRRIDGPGPGPQNQNWGKGIERVRFFNFNPQERPKVWFHVLAKESTPTGLINACLCA